MNSIYPRMLCTKFGWNWPSSFKERILKYFQYNFTISLLSPLWEGFYPSFEQTWISSTQRSFVPCLVEIGPVVLENKIFSPTSPIISPRKRAEPFIWTNLNPLHPRMILCHICLKLAQWFWRRRFFFLYFQYNFTFCYYLPLKKSVALYLDNIEFPPSKEAMC